MPEAPKRIYWDASVFLHYIEGSTKWMFALDALLAEASASNTVEIITSTASITEVAFAQVERADKSLDPVVEAAIDALWNDRSAIRLIEYSQVIAREARTLIRQAIPSGRSLKPMDAIHIATAVNRRVDDFHTLDRRLQNGWQDLGFPVRDPIAPSRT